MLPGPSVMLVGFVSPTRMIYTYNIYIYILLYIYRDAKYMYDVYSYVYSTLVYQVDYVFVDNGARRHGLS